MTTELPRIHGPTQFSQQDVVAILSRQTLNFSVSDVAAMCGFHPYKNLPQLVFRLVYQGRVGTILQTMDASALGLTLEYVTEEQVCQNLATLAGEKTVKALEKAISQKPQTVREATRLKEEIVQKAKESSKLNPIELKALQEGTRQLINTRFGSHHEDNALDQCELEFGWEIYGRNQEILEWPFRKVEGADTVEAMDNAKPGRYYWERRDSKRLKTEQDVVCLDLTDDNDDEAKADAIVDETRNPVCNVEAPLNEAVFQNPQGSDESNTDMGNPQSIQSAIQEERPHAQPSLVTIPAGLPPSTTCPEDKSDSTKDSRPFFIIRGSVDGRRDELAPSVATTEEGDEFEDWTMRPIIVELKHRMNRIFTSVPLYEQIQACTYCLMYGVKDADVVQVIRQEEEVEEEADKDVGKPTKKDSSCNETETSNQKNTISNYFPPKKGHSNDQSSQGEGTAVPEVANDLTNLARELTKQNGEGIVADPKDQEEETENKDPNVAKMGPHVAVESKVSPKVVDTVLPSSSSVTTTNESYSDHEKKTSGSEADEKGHVAGQDEKKSQPTTTASTVQKTNPKTKKESAEGGARKIQKRRRKKKRLVFQADRISLDDPMYQHENNWHDVILPRLYSFASAIYSIRKDDSKRYRLMQSCSDPLGQLERDAWEMLLQECAWLKDCDTAFRRENRL